MNLANRQVGQRLQVTGGSTGRVYFGPFMPGDQVKSLMVNLSSASPTAGDCVALQIKVFGLRIPDTSAEFAANGRSLTGSGGIAANQPRLPIETAPWYLPVNWTADLSETYLGVEVTESAGDNLDGAVFVDSCESCWDDDGEYVVVE